MQRILVINPGSVTTKLAVYDGREELWRKTIEHTAEELLPFAGIADQKAFRKARIEAELVDNHFELSSLAAIIGRGGLLHPMEGGVYRIGQAMLDDLTCGRYGEHASNLGAILAAELAADYNIPALIADPVVVDEMGDLARFSGYPGMDRVSIFHALNQKAVAHRYAQEQNVDYNKCSLIVAHFGGGSSVGAHENGRVIDVNNGLDGDGAFSAERTGGLPLRSLMDAFWTSKYTNRDEMYRSFIGKGGLYAYLGTKDGRVIESRILAGDEEAKLVYEAMAYQIAKEIGAAATVLKGRQQAIILTGGMAHSTRVCDWIRERVSFLAPVVVYPGEDELPALAENAKRVLDDPDCVLEYQQWN